jgi:hypothetical protein
VGSVLGNWIRGLASAVRYNHSFRVPGSPAQGVESPDKDISTLQREEGKGVIYLATLFARTGLLEGLSRAYTTTVWCSLLW